MYPASTGPRYIPGGSTNAVMCLVVAGLALLLRFLHIRENKRLERVETEAAAGVTEAQPRADQPAPGFRYIY